MKKYLATLLFAVLLAFPAAAQGTGDAVVMTSQGDRATVTVTLPQNEASGVTSLSLSFYVQKGTEGSVQFDFSDTLQSSVQQYRYNAETGRLTVYLSGTKPIFTDGERNARNDPSGFGEECGGIRPRRGRFPETCKCCVRQYGGADHGAICRSGSDRRRRDARISVGAGNARASEDAGFFGIRGLCGFRRRGTDNFRREPFLRLRSFFCGDGQTVGLFPAGRQRFRL